MALVIKVISITNLFIFWQSHLFFSSTDFEQGIPTNAI